MRCFASRATSHVVLGGGAIVAALAIPLATVRGQTQNGTLTGRVSDSSGTGLAAAVTLVGNNRYGVYANADGAYAVTELPAGRYHVEVRFIGFQTDTFSASIVGGQTVRRNVLLRATASTLKTVVVSSPRLNETIAGALEEQKTADNIVTVMSGDEIRSLPNANAAEALARMPGVTSERDEGEGKYVEIRGTPPELQHVTIDGVDVPGTLAHDVRAVKLDDVPSDLLGAIEVHKTLTADLDADAIGGSVNLVTKVPEGAPRGYIAGQYGLITLLDHSNGQGSLTYGGRIGDSQKFGFLLNGSYDRTNRVINDVEPFYSADFLSGGVYTPIPNGSAFNHTYPSSWSQREYNYFRTRYGLGGDLDYRFSPTSSVFLKGLWGAFFDQANRWETNFGSPASDSLIGGTPTALGAGVGKDEENRGPIEHTWGFTGGGRGDMGIVHMEYALNYAGSTATTHDHLQDDYAYSGSSFNYTYNTSRLVPRYFLDASTNAAIQTAGNYPLTTIQTDNELTNGQIFGGRADWLLPYEISGLPAGFKFGAKYSNEHKGYLSNQPPYAFVGATPVTLADFASTFSDPNFYSHICPGCYQVAPFGSMPAVQNYFHEHPGDFQIQSNTLSDQLATFAGTEQIVAGYGMQTIDIGSWHVNAGLRVENTNVGYLGHVASGVSDTAAAAVQRGTHAYTDLFPSVLVRYAIDQNTNVRAAFTGGISRPNYPDLAPSFSAVGATPGSRSNGLSEGNPDLKPERAWNTDLLAEHYFPSVGVLSGGMFYKDISDFIFTRTFLYPGPLPQYAGTFYVSQPQNGPSADLWGFEADYMQHLTFLPGVLQGIGFDVNWTHVESRAAVPLDTTVTYVNQNGTTESPYTTPSATRRSRASFRACTMWRYCTITRP